MSLNSHNPPGPKADPESKRILVLDDEEEIRELLRTTLEAEGFRVRTGRDGRQVIKMASNFDANLIITDVMMPGGGGYDVLRNLQSDPQTKETPVLIMTGYSFDTSTKELMKQEPNVKDIMDKPIRPFLFLSKIHELLNTLSKDEKMIQERKEKGPLQNDELKGFDDIF